MLAKRLLSLSAVYIIICYQDYRVSFNRDALINFAEVISYRFVIVFQLQGHDIDGLSDTYINNQGGRGDWVLSDTLTESFVNTFSHSLI